MSRALSFYVFYFDTAFEGEKVYAQVIAAQMPHRLQKFHSSAYAGATSLGRGWGRIYIPEAALETFMELTNNQLAPEPELYTEQVSPPAQGCLGSMLGWWRR